jgi:hypothetical protein
VFTDTNKHLLFPRLADDDWKAQIVSQKGWIREAEALAAESVAKLPKRSFSLRHLMLGWSSPAVRNALTKQLREGPDYPIFLNLAKDPALCPEIDALAREWWSEVQLTMGEAPRYHERVKIGMAAGIPEALDYAIRLTAQATVLPHATDSPVYNLDEAAANHIGLKEISRDWQRMNQEFRSIKASDYQFNPSTRTWSKKQP